MITTQTYALNSAHQFFYDHAGYSYDSKRETQEEGRRRCARALAHAERRARAVGWQLHLTASGETLAWQGDNFDVTLRAVGETFIGYNADLLDERGAVLAGLGQVTFADNDTREPYARVLFAMLALEALANRDRSCARGG